MRFKVFAVFLMIFSLTSCATTKDKPIEATRIASTLNPAYSLLSVVNAQNSSARLSALEAPRILAHTFLAAYAAYLAADDSMNRDYAAAKAGALVASTMHIDRVRANNILAIVDSFREGEHIQEDKLAISISNNVLAIANSDGHADSMTNYAPKQGTTIYNWEPTGRGTYGLEPGWLKIQPLIKSSSNCVTPTPLEQQVRDEAIAMLKQYSVNDAVGQDVLWWLAGTGTPTPSGQWLNIASNALRDKKLATKDSLLTLTVASIAANDAAIAGWREKYRHNLARPETMWKILEKDQTLIPVLPRETPPHPSYPSGHSLFGGAVTTVLKNAIGDSALRDALPADMYAPAQRRDWTSIDAALNEASLSRIHAGFHMPMDTKAGEELGSCVANAALANYKELLKGVTNAK